MTVASEIGKPTTRVEKFVAGVGAIATVVALGASSLALLFTLVPALQPKPPPEKLGGTIGKMFLALEVPYIQYVNELRPGTSNGDPKVRDHPNSSGTMVFVRASLEGFELRTYGVRPVLYSADTKKPYHPLGQAEIDAFIAESDAKSPSAPADALEFRCFIAGKLKPGKYFVQAQLYDQGELNTGNSLTRAKGATLLDVANSPTFTVR